MPDVTESGTPTSTGLTSASFAPLGMPTVLEAARAAADAGYGSYWAAETTGHEAFGLLGAVAASVPGIGLGTGVLAMQLRTPMLAAMGAATLQDISPESEVFLGFGVSSPVVVGRWHGTEPGDRPVERAGEYIDLVRACLGGESVTHDGEFYRASRFRLGVRLTQKRPSIVLGALNERMLMLAGRSADGVLLNYLPAEAVPWCVEQVRAGETAAGREPGSCRVHAYVHVGVCDRDAALDAARKDLFSYAVVPAYARAFARAGFADEVEAIVEAHGRRDREAAVAAVSERMVDAIDICGDADTVAAAVQRYRDAGVDNAVIMPLPWARDRRKVIMDTIEAAAPTSGV